MKIIVFEGMDKSGKNTASLFLTSMLQEYGFETVHSEFHRYDTPTGELIQKYLHGTYNVSNETIQLIMSADKQAQQDWFKELENSGVEFLILDRYTLSQKVYSDYFLDTNEQENKELFRKIYDLIIETFREPDWTIYLDCSPETSMMRKGQHGANDIYEQNKSLLTYVREKYLSELDKQADKIILNAEQTVDEVNKELAKQAFNKIIKPYISEKE